MIDAGLVSEFVDGQPKAILIDGREVAIIKWRSDFYAIRNRCPHMHALLSVGFVRPKLCAGAQIGALVTDEDEPVLSCPWHLWQFDLKTGVVLGDPKYRIPTYRTERIGDRLYVDVSRLSSHASAAPAEIAS